MEMLPTVTYQNGIKQFSLSAQKHIARRELYTQAKEIKCKKKKKRKKPKKKENSIREERKET